MKVAAHYRPALAPHPVPAEACKHPASAMMAVALRVDDDGLAVRGTLCLNCGTECTGNMTAAQAVWDLWEEYGWHAQIGKRLCELSLRIAASARVANDDAEIRAACLDIAAEKHGSLPPMSRSTAGR